MDDKIKNLREDSTIGSRVARYGKVSGTMAGLAARLAGQKFLGLKIEKDAHAQQLMLSLGNLKGPLMKVGQILATIPEAVPAEYAQAFQELQSNAPPMGWPFVRRRMKTELGAGWQDRFESFEREAAAAASLGQVHRAVSKDGRDLACKLQYPDMESAIRSDLSQLKILFATYSRIDKSIATDHVYEELSARLYEELDYEREAKHGRLYRDMLSGTNNVHVPEVIAALSTKRLLTSTWLEGSKILDFVDSDLEQRNTLALNMFHAWYVPLYKFGIIHGDPHLGNYSVRPDNGINLLDFGCVRVFPPSFVGGVIDLYRALQNDDMDRAVHSYETWGFKNLSKEQIEILNIWARFLYGPLLENRVRLIGEAKHGVYGRETAEEVHKKLREASKTDGSVRIPREFVFMDRAALGLGSVFIHLKAEINWYQLFNEMIDGFDINEMAQRQSDMLKKHDLLDEIEKETA